MIPEFALLMSLLQATPKVPPRVACRDVALTARLLRDDVVPKWTTITKADLLDRWPGLQAFPVVPEWPASLIANVDNIYCKEILSVEEGGGIRSMELFFSGTRVQVLDAARELSAALGFTLSSAEKKELDRKRWVVLLQMSRVPPMGLAVDVIKSLNGKAADWGVQLSVVTIPVPR